MFSKAIKPPDFLFDHPLSEVSSQAFARFIVLVVMKSLSVPVVAALCKPSTGNSDADL